MKTVIIYSGGIDSTVLLYDLLQKNSSIHALTVNYGQKHQKEIEQAKAITQSLNILHTTVDLSSLKSIWANSSLIDAKQNIPHGHYTENSMKSTVVPNRNMLLIALAGSLAASQKFDTIAYGAHSGDHTIYPDCRESFAQAMDQALQLCDWQKIKLHRPFIHYTKSDIIKLGHQLNVPFEKTWSCYTGGEFHCGNCGTCVERREAFHLAKIEDPTTYSPEAFDLESILSKNQY